MKRFLLLVLAVSMFAACTSATSGDPKPGVVEASAEEGVGGVDAGPPDSVPTTLLSAQPTEETSTTTSSEAVVPPGLITDGGEDYVWTVIAVEYNDVLNVRGDPHADSPIEATLDPWSTEFVASLSVESNETGRWRQVVTTDGFQGWVNARFVVAQPADLTLDESESLAVITKSAVDWIVSGSGTAAVDWIAGSGLWIGGIGVYADGPHPWMWSPTRELDDLDEWYEERLFEHPAFQCGSMCVKSAVSFLDLESLDESALYLVDDIAPEKSRGFLDGGMWKAPVSMHRVVIYQPPTEGIDAEGNSFPYLDFKRIHFIFDWSDGEPRIALVQTWGWTP